MTLTIDSDWLREIRRANVQPVAWVQVEYRSVTATITTVNTDATLGTPTANLFAGMTVTGSGIAPGTKIGSITDSTHLEMTAAATASASVSITFKKVFNFLSATASEITDGQTCVDEVSPITRALDPYTRQISTDECNVIFMDDGVIRHINATYPIMGKKVIIKVGTAALGEAEFQTFFTGFINELLPIEGGLELTCVEFTDMLNDSSFAGSFVDEHPLVVLKQLLLHADVPADMIDDDSFDPAQSVYDSIRQFSITSIMMEKVYTQQVVIHPMGGTDYLAPVEYEAMRATGASPDGYPNPEGPMSGRALVDHIVMFLAGMLYVESGTIKFKLYDKTVAVARHLTADDYNGFVQLEAQATILNDFRIEIGGHHEGRYLQLKDAASITEYGEYTRTETPTFMTATMEVDGINSYDSPFDSDLDSGDELDQTFAVHNGQVTGLAGTQGTGSGGPGALAFGSGAAGGYTTSTKYGVLEMFGELIKVTGITMQSSPFAFAPLMSDDGVVEVETYQNGDLILCEKVINRVHITGGVRGFGGTTPHVMSNFVFHHHTMMRQLWCNDVTIPYQWATNYVLPRFAHGLPICEFNTSFEHWDLEVGDLISIDSDVFLWRNVDGISSTTKLEIIGKEIDPLSDQPLIKFTVALAVPASVPSQTITYETLKTPVTAGGKNKGGVDGVSFMAATSGSAMPTGGASARIDSTNYDVIVDACTSMTGRLVRDYSENISLKGLTASKDHFIAIDSTTGLFTAHTVTTGAAEPRIHGSDVRVCKVVAGASNITAVTDERELAPITGAMIDRSSLQLEQLVPAPNFSRWVMGPAGPPIGWTETAGTWGTDLIQGTAQKRSGKYSLKLIDSGSDAGVISDEFVVTPGEVYEVNLWARADDDSTAYLAKLSWYTETRTVISSITVFSDSADSADTWEQKQGYGVAPATATTCRVRLLRSTSGPEVYFDRVELRRGTPTFSAYLNADQSPSTQDRINFNTEDHDNGDWFTTGGAKAAAPTAGVYSFSWNMKIEPSTNAKEVNILIRKNASAYNNGTALKTFNLGDMLTGDSGHEMFNFSFEALKLEAGDYVSAFITFSAGQPVIAGGAAESSFSGRRVN